MFPLPFLNIFKMNDLTKGFIIVLLFIVALIVIPNLGQISAKLGFDTVASMKDKVAKAEANADKAESAAKTNSNTIDTLGKIDKAKDDITINVVDKGSKIDNKTTNRINNRGEQVDKVKKTPVIEKDITPELKLAMELSGESLEKVRISQVNIASIWDSYCSTTDQCKGNG